MRTCVNAYILVFLVYEALNGKSNNEAITRLKQLTMIFEKYDEYMINHYFPHLSHESGNGKIIFRNEFILIQNKKL